MTRLIRVSSRALGPRLGVRVYVYDTPGALRAAASGFNGNDHEDTLGATQAYTDREGRARVVVVRLTSAHLGTQIVSHEMHHAATALYGAHLDDDTPVRHVLTHYNEEFAHLFSDLMHHLVDALYRHGYYAKEAA